MNTFACDYNTGGHPVILRQLVSTNLDICSGYGEDHFTLQAEALIKQNIANQNAKVYFVSGGTQANLMVLKTMMRPYEAVICVDTGHINVHECGAIEATGHKVISVPNVDGKLTCDAVLKVIIEHDDTHMVAPKVIYISNTSELGSIYSREEITNLYKLAQKYHLYLFIDGARLGSALAAQNNDLSFEDLGMLCDAFTIGGTKNGALFGEAIVINNPKLSTDFTYIIKQSGGLFAKGRLIGIQFLAMFTDDLYLKIAAHANEMALTLKNVMVTNDYESYVDSYTNQQFFSVTQDQYDFITKRYNVADFGTIDGKRTIRFVTSWSTKKEDIIELNNYLRNR